MEPAIDPASFERLRASMGDEETLKEVLQLAIAEGDSDAGALRQALARRAWVDVKAVAHRWKSSARLVGALPLGNALEAVERAAAAGSALPSQEAAVVQAWAGAREALSRRLG